VGGDFDLSNSPNDHARAHEGADPPSEEAAASDSPEDEAAVREAVALRLVEDTPEVVPADDEQQEDAPEHMYQRVALALERELAHGQPEWNGSVRERLRAQELSTDSAMIDSAEGPLEQRGLRLHKTRDWSQSGRWMWQLTPVEGQLNLDERSDPPLDPPPDPTSPDGPLVKQVRRLYGGQS
jgi:hypothetical protein